MSALSLQDVTLSHGSFDLALDAWHLEAGSFQALLGCNGAGKSTLLKVATAELSFRGRVLLHGKPWSDWAPDARARHLAVLPQASELSFGFTAAEVVGLGAIPLTLGWRAVQQAVRKVMEQAGCAELADQAYPRLSGGERQRVHFARVLLQLSQAETAPVLLLDEPTSAQDLRHQHRLLQTMRSLAEASGYAVAAVLHDLNHALRYADHCSVLEGGRLVRRGDPQNVLTPQCVEALWGYPASHAVDSLGRRLLA